MIVGITMLPASVVFMLLSEVSCPTFNFYFLGYTKYRESIAFAQKIDFQILMNVHVLRATESKKRYFWSVCLSVSLSLSVCLSVCLCVATITQKIIELAQPNLVCDLI